MTASEPPTVGLFHEIEPPTDVVVGRRVAVSDFTDALARHGRQHRYALFAPEAQVPALARGLPADGRAEVRPRGALADLDALRLAAWHDLQADFHAPFALRARARRPFPVTVVHHALSYAGLLHEAVLRLLLAKAQPYDAVVCTSAAARGALRELLGHVAEHFEAEHGARLAFGGRLEVLPLGVDVERFRPLDRVAARAAFGIPENAFVLLWLGRLSAVDKADLLPLVQAFTGLVRANPQRELLLVCAGTEHPGERFGAMLADFARHLGVAERVRVLTDAASFVPRRELLYAAADVFVSPADNVQETFGLTPIEAMAAGVPQVVSDWNGYRDTVAEGETGYRVPVRRADCAGDVSESALLTDPAFQHLALAQSVAVDMDALAVAVQRLIDDPAHRAAVAVASRRRAETHYAWPVVIARYESLWSELAAAAASAAGPVPDGARYAHPDWGRAFAGFASETIGDHEPLGLTAAGEELVAGQVSLPMGLIERWGHLDIDVLRRIVAGFAHARQRGEALTLARIVAVMGGHGAPPSLAARLGRHAMFLVKYGFVERRSPGATLR